MWCVIQGNITQPSKRVSPAIRNNMDLEGIRLTEIRQLEKDTRCVVSHLWNQKKERKKRSVKLRDREQRSSYRAGRGVNRESLATGANSRLRDAPSLRVNVKPCDCSWQHSTVRFKPARRAELQCSHQERGGEHKYVKWWMFSLTWGEGSWCRVYACQTTTSCISKFLQFCQRHSHKNFN